MASFISNLWNRFSSKQAPLTVMAVGLDDSGKTSLLAHIKSASSGAPQTSSLASSFQSGEASPHCSAMNDSQSLREIGSPPVNDEELLFMRGAEFKPTASHSGRFSSPNQRENVAPTIGYNYDRIQLKGHTINVLDFSGQSKYRGLWEEFYNCVDAIVFVLDSSDLIRLVVARDELENMLSHPYFSSLQATSDSSRAMGTDDAKLAFQMAQKQLVISQGKLLQSPLEDYDGSRASSRREQAPAQAGALRCCRRRSRIPILFLANKADLTNAADTELIAQTLNLSELPQSRHPWHIQATSVQTSQGIQEGFDWLLEELLRQAAAS